ncbi:MAG: hypothetical protein ACO3FI_02550 [Cyclobacteriaceae bacterium]
MKKFYFLFVVVFSALTISAQTISEKNMSTGAAASFGESNFKRAPKRVYIAGFRVNFHVIASGGASTIDSKTSLTVALDGVDNPDFQKLADDTYNEFISNLKSNGFEIIPVEEAAKTEYYQGWIPKEGGSISSAQYKGHVSAVPTGFKYLIKNETAKGKEKTTFVDTTPKLSRELGAATIMNVEFTFPLFEVDASQSGYFSITSVKAKIKYQMGASVRIVSSEKFGKDAVMYFTPKGNYIEIEAPVFKEKKIREQAVAMNYSYGYLTYLSAVERNVTHVVAADHDLYVGEAGRLMKEYNAYCLDQFYRYALK